MREWTSLSVGDRVTLMVLTIGCLPDGSTEIQYPAGSHGMVQAVGQWPDEERFVEVSIWSDDPDATIVNIFEEGDGSLATFLRKAEAAHA